MRRMLALAALAALLTGCSGDDHEDLKQWMQENTQGLRGGIPPLPQVKPYEPVSYDAGNLPDPFRPGKIEPESRRLATGGKGGLEPDFAARERRDSLLEKYPLESLKMIGYLNVNNRPVAVIQAEQHVKQVKVGEYIGLDFGMVARITDREVKIRELVQEPSGGWSERSSTLYLQGREEGAK